MNINQARQAGFTLIELVMVIVILGILAAVALPRFVDLRQDAATAAVAGVAGSLGSASALNKAGRIVSTSHGTAITSCNGVTSALDGSLGTNYTISTTAVTNGATASCSVTGDYNGVTANATFVAHGIT